MARVLGAVVITALAFIAPAFLTDSMLPLIVYAWILVMFVVWAIFWEEL